MKFELAASCGVNTVYIVLIKIIMSIIHNKSSSTLLDHNKYIMILYQNVNSGEETVHYRLLPGLFSLTNNKNNIYVRKRNWKSHIIIDEANMVKQMYNIFLSEIPITIRKQVSECYKMDTGTVRDLSKQLFESTVFNHSGINGGNASNEPLKCVLNDEIFLLPKNSRFFCGSVKEQCEKLKGRKYQLVIADPPWWNKYIRRLKLANNKMSYSMMYNEDIASIPVKELLSSNSVVAVWCTNSPSNISAVKDLIFPKWGVEYMTTWYWLKVTTDLEPMCQFGVGSQKQPYERLILGKVGDIKEVSSSHLVVSVPSALHSHKPPLLDLLSPYINEDKPQTLELFARYLLPNTTSIGYEPLKWQHISLYEAVT